jgi:hypothetical protein
MDECEEYQFKRILTQVNSLKDALLIDNKSHWNICEGDAYVNKLVAVVIGTSGTA